MSHSAISPTTPNDRLFAILTGVIVLAPLPLGSNRPWSWNLLALTVAALALAWAVLRLRGRCRPGLPLDRLAIPAVLFLAAVTWAGLQVLPITPPSWNHPVWAEAAAALGRPASGTVSADPQKTLQTMTRLLGYGLIFLLATQLGHQRHRAARGLKAVAVAAIAYGAYALTTHLLDFDYILWLPKWAYPGDATGTFVGRAAFGAFAGIGVVACLALAIQGSGSRLPSIGTGERIERLLARSVPWLVASAFLWMAVLASHSRGAFLVTAAACLTLTAAAAVARLMRPRHSALLLLVLAVLGAVALAAGDDITLARLMGSEGELTGDRPSLMRLTAAAIADAPLSGHGLGTFERAFMPYRDLSLPRPVIYDYAHSSWEEAIMDLGWPAGLCLIAAVVLPVLSCCAGLVRRRRDQIYPAAAAAVAVLLGLQAVVDFTVQIPALAALLAYLLGIGYSQSWSHDESGP